MEQSMGLHCSNDICHCDWRIQITDCVEETNLRIINTVNIIISSLAFILGSVIFSRRLYKGHRVFYWAQSSPRWIRPRPVDSMIILLILFLFFRLLHSIFLLADVGRGNWMWRQFLWEFPWQFGYGAIALYFVGITHTIIVSHNITGWVPSPGVVDFVGTVIFTSTFVLDIPFCLIAGYYADLDPYRSELFLKIEYMTWFIHCAVLASLIFLAGTRLILILKASQRKFDRLAEGGAHHTAVRAGILKIELVVVALGGCLWCFALMALSYSLFRHQSLVNAAANYILCICWCFLGSLTTLFVFVAIVLR
ncbi:hypothetical protein BX666DRAFT_2006059 [Dichotomocladium elegans]|nr:hypothetical protein BX666DRAFT_2006059 [Dichotomocladium elegans]